MVKVGRHQLRNVAGEYEHKGNPADAYDDDDEYPITDREYMRLARMAVKHRFPIEDNEKRAAVVAALKRLASSNDRIALSAAKVLASMERINQADELAADEPPVVIENKTEIHIEGPQPPTIDEVLDGISQLPDMLALTQKRLRDNDASESRANGNGANGNGNGSHD
jgi:hypothetical protein